MNILPDDGHDGDGDSNNDGDVDDDDDNNNNEYDDHGDDDGGGGGGGGDDVSRTFLEWFHRLSAFLSQSVN